MPIFKKNLATKSLILSSQTYATISVLGCIRASNQLSWVQTWGLDDAELVDIVRTGDVAYQPRSECIRPIYN